MGAAESPQAPQPQKVSQPAAPSRESLVRASKALRFFVFKGGRSEHGDAEVAVARAIDEAVKESRK